MTSLPVGSVIRNSNTLFCCVRRGYWRPLRASGLGPGGFTDDELNDMGVSDLVLRGDGEIEDAAELYRRVAAAKTSVASTGADLEKQYIKLRLSRSPDFRPFLTTINAMPKDELIELRKDAKDSSWREQLLLAIEQYTGAARWVRKEFVSREDGANKNITLGTRVSTRKQPQFSMTTQGPVEPGHGVVEQAAGLGGSAKKACGTTAAWLIRFDPSKPEKVEAAEEPEIGAPTPQRPKLDWIAVRADAQGNVTERNARLPRLFWPDLGVVDYMSGPRYGAQGRYEVVRRMAAGRSLYGGASADEAWERTGFCFSNLTDLWKHLDEERELRMGRK